MTESIREAMEKAFEEAETKAEEEVEEEPEDGLTTEESAEPEEDNTQASGEDTEGEEPSEEPEGTDGSEDSKQEEESEPDDAEPVATDEKAPASWTPKAREHWAKLPPEIRAEVQKREKEISDGLQQASGHKKMAEEYYSVVAPYQQLIQAQNSTPAQAVSNLMQTAARLTMGTQVQKAQVLTEIIKNYEVDIETLDQVLSGQELPQGPNADLAKLLDERLAPVQQFMSQVESGRQQSQQSRVEDVNTFAADPANEFFEDVRMDMADLVEMASKRGESLTLKQAYDKACAMNPQVSEVLATRKAASSTVVSEAELAKKRRAASSVRGKSAEKSESIPNDLRSQLSQAWDDNS